MLSKSALQNKRNKRQDKRRALKRNALRHGPRGGSRLISSYARMAEVHKKEQVISEANLPEASVTVPATPSV